MNDIKIAVILPSRGLVFSRTADELLQNLTGYDYDIFFAHGLPIPLCFNKPLKTILNASNDYSHVWLVEDDMCLPDGTLDSLLLLDSPVATMDYPVTKSGQGAVFSDKERRVIFCGTGCTLVKIEAFDELSEPYFRTDIRWTATNYGDFIRLTAMKIDNPSLPGYGLHDTNFGIKLWQAGIPISVAGRVGQRKLIKLGEAGTNEGAHQIEEWWKIRKDVLLKKFQNQEVQPLGKLITVQTVDGEMNVLPDKAKKMIKAGVATAIPKQSVGLDFNGYEL